MRARFRVSAGEGATPTNHAPFFTTDCECGAAARHDAHLARGGRVHHDVGGAPLSITIGTDWIDVRLRDQYDADAKSPHIGRTSLGDASARAPGSRRAVVRQLRCPASPSR